MVFWSDFIRLNQNTYQFINDESWVILSVIEQSIKTKIEAIGTPLKEWNINIYRGVLTGYNGAFIIDRVKKDQLIKEDPKSAEIIRPILRGRDIKRYSCDFCDLWLLNVHNGVKEKNIKPINIDDYLAIKKHLDNFYPALEKRLDKGVTPYHLRNCAYMDDFFKQKIIYPNMTKFVPFFLDNSGFMQNDKSFMIVGNHLEFLVAFLNSSLFKYCFLNDFPELQGGTRELRKIFFDKIPVIRIDDKINDKFKKILDNMSDFRIKNLPTKQIEKEIDNMIFDLYNLTDLECEEIGFIEIN